MSNDTPKRSAVENIKDASQFLRGGIAQELHADTEKFSDADKQLIKFHGSYQQEDRDARKSRRKDGLGKHFMFMVRCKIPGGKLTAKQYLAVDELAEKYANGTLRITSRQGIQLHGVMKNDLKDTIKAINECLLTTLGACGDVNRNVMVTPCPRNDTVLHEMQELGDAIAAHLAPKGGAYHEIWLNGKSVSLVEKPEVIEPIYGSVYLPRKFKIGIATPDNNIVDIYTQDLAFVGFAEDGHIAGYNIHVGGGSGRTPNNPETFPNLAKPICYIHAADAVAMAEAVVKLFRDHGNRENRKRARIKYVVNDWGIEKFRQVLSEYFTGEMHDPKSYRIDGIDLMLGWHSQNDGKYWYGVSVENGRIKDEGGFQLRTLLREIIKKWEPEIRLTPQQDILLCNLPEGAQHEINDRFGMANIKRPMELSLVQTLSMACPAIPTCGLAISESERTLPDLIDEFETVLTEIGLDKEEISIRMTGCPNGCVRPYQSDIGLVGRSGSKYSLFLGGHTLGYRLNFLFQDLVPFEEIVPMLNPIFKDFKKNRANSETFGDFCQRMGPEALHQLVPESLRKPLPEKQQLPAETCLAS